MSTHTHVAGGNSQNHEDEKAHDERSPSDRDGGDPQEHVHSSQEDDQRTD